MPSTGISVTSAVVHRLSSEDSTKFGVTPCSTSVWYTGSRNSGRGPVVRNSVSAVVLPRNS